MLEALVAVGLQHSCRVVCIRRRTLGEVLESMLAVGEAAGVGQEAARTVDRLRSRLRRAAGQGALAAQVSGARRPRVLLLRSAAPICTGTIVVAVCAMCTMLRLVAGSCVPRLA